MTGYGLRQCEVEKAFPITFLYIIYLVAVIIFICREGIYKTAMYEIKVMKIIKPQGSSSNVWLFFIIIYCMQCACSHLYTNICTQ